MAAKWAVCVAGFLVFSSVKTFDIPYLNESVDPCDNFYEFTCGNFKNVFPLPENAVNIDHFSILQEEIHTTVKHILSSKPTSKNPIALQKAKSFYKSCRDVYYLDMSLPSMSVLDNFGEWPVISYEKNVGKKLTWPEIGDLIAEYGLPFFFDFTVTSSHFNATSNVIYVSKDKMTNPDAGIIGKIDENFDLLAPGRQSRGATENMPYHIFLRKIARRLRDIRGTFKSNKAIEKEIEQTIMYLRYISGGGIMPENVNLTSLGNEFTIEKLQNWTDNYFGEDLGMNWLEFMNHAFKYTGVEVTKDMRVMVDKLAITYGILNLYKMSDADTVKNYIIGRLLTHMAPDSDQFMRKALQEFYESLGYPFYERDEYCLRKTIGYPGSMDFSLALTYEYQRYHYNINKLDQARIMVNDLTYAFLDMLEEAAWLDDATREKANAKVREIMTLLAYPEFLEDGELLDEYYENLQICSWDHFGNTQRLRAFGKALNLKDIGTPKNRELWTNSPLVVNAFYNRANNRIVFPIAIINPEFFSGETSILDYARMGSIIGHEITHGFDVAGSMYSEDGILAGWWSNETLKAFNARTDCFLDQYSNYYIDEIDKFVNGSYTLNENLADNGGLRAAYLAYQTLLKRPTPMRKSLMKYSDEQLFFIGFGSMWCMTETEYYLNKMHASQPYPPGRYRVNGAISNNQEFAKAFNCPAGSNMNPKEKCVLW